MQLKNYQINNALKHEHEEFDISISEIEPDNKSKGRYKIVLDEDCMTAFLLTFPSSKGIFQIDKELLFKDICDSGIKSGINPSFFESIPRYRKAKTLIAKGKFPISGKDAQIILHYENFSKDEIEEMINSENNIDHHDLHSVISVNSGDILVEIIKPIDGEDGFNVNGRIIPHKKGKDIKLISGENTKFINDNKFLIATAPGTVEKNENIFEVISLLNIKGDVDYSVGNIDFPGSIKIHGNVLPGFSIKAKYSIEIDGNVDKANIVSGGDIIIRKGYYGNDNSHLNCGNNLSVRSLENAIVNCHGNIYADQYIINSKINTKNNVYIQHKSKGRIIGGRIIAGGSISVCNLGSPSIVKTVIDLGIPRLYGKDHNYKFNMTNYYINSLRRIHSQIQWLKTIQSKTI